jgi:hypothetical protein
VKLLDDALASGLCVEEAEGALAELASNPAHPEVVAQARESLQAAFAEPLGDPETAPAAIARLARLDSPAAVDILAGVLTDPGLADAARGSLLSLTQSPDRTVASAAKEALVSRAEHTLSATTAEPWAVETLEAVGTFHAIEVLGRLLDVPPVAVAAGEALRRLQRSKRTDVATAATRELDRGTAIPPLEPDAPEPIPRQTSSSSLTLLVPHFDVVLRLLANGRLVPFLGHGSALADRPAGVSWAQAPKQYPPTMAELAGHLAATFGYPEEEPRDLQRVAEYTEVFVGRDPLYEELARIFDVEFPPSRLHRLLAELPRRFAQRSGLTQVIVTTAWDTALERAFDEADEPVEVLSYVADGPDKGSFARTTPDGTRVLVSDPTQATQIEPEAGTVIVRLHGGIERDRALDSFVISDNDRLEFGTRAAQGFSFLPPVVSKLLIQTSFLFLGFSLHDWSTRLFLNALNRERRTDQRSWSIQFSPTKLEVELWRHRRVEVLDVGLDEYVSELVRRLEEFDVGVVPA